MCSKVAKYSFILTCIFVDGVNNMSRTTRRLQPKPHSEIFERVVNQAKSDKNIHEITAEELKILMDSDCSNVILIDVREQDERAAFYIEGSVHISRGVLERDIEKTISLIESDNKQIITICSGGYRSVLAAASLVDMGYKNICSVEGGLRKYLEQNYDNIVETNTAYISHQSSLSIFNI